MSRILYDFNYQNPCDEGVCFLLLERELTRGNVSPPSIKVFTPIFPDENVAPVTKLAGTKSKIVAFPKKSTIFRILGPKGSKNFQNPEILVLEKNFCPKKVPS